jgi:hypothetical protein
VKLTIHFHLMLKLRKSGDVSPISIRLIGIHRDKFTLYNQYLYEHVKVFLSLPSYIKSKILTLSHKKSVY